MPRIGNEGGYGSPGNAVGGVGDTVETSELTDNAVTNAKLADMAVDTVKGRATAGTGDPEDIATTGSGSVVRATSPTLVTPALGTPASGVLTNATGLPTAGLVDAAVSLAKMANLATARFIGRTTAGTGVPEALTAAQATALLDAATATLKGLVPTPPNNTTTFLRGDATFATPAGGGAVTREGGNTTEATTTSTSAVDLLSAAALTISTTETAQVVVAHRKTSGAATATALGITLNTTVVVEATINGNLFVDTGTVNEAQSRWSISWFGPRITNYELKDSCVGVGAGRETNAVPVLNSITRTAAQPVATITDLVIRAISTSLVTCGADELHIYSMAVS